MTVHSILPPSPSKAVDDVLSSAGIEHVAHGDNEPVDAATIAAADPKAQGDHEYGAQLDAQLACSGFRRPPTMLRPTSSCWRADDHGDLIDPTVTFEPYG